MTKHAFFFAICLAAASSASAQPGGILLPSPFYSLLTAECLPGAAGYLQISVVGPRHTHHMLREVVGTGKACADQAAVLNSRRARIDGLTQFAICTAGPARLRTWSVDHFGTLTAQSDVYYGSAPACAAAAEAFNAPLPAPACLPPQSGTPGGGEAVKP